MLRTFLRCLLSGAFAATFCITGCSTNSPTPTTTVAGMSGSVHGGQQPISGATIQLYTVGSTTEGPGGTPLLTAPVTSDGNGNFSITGLYTCPTASVVVYVVATGGSPGSGITNKQIALMAAIGKCGSLKPSTFININELTTVAAVYAFAPYMASYSLVGTEYVDATDIASALALSGYIANVTTGTTPGLNVPAGYSVPIPQVNTIADLLAACINSSGGVSGDTSVCGQFFALALPGANFSISTDTISALLWIAQIPTLNTAALFDLIPASSPFQPTDPIVPPDFSIRMLANSPFTVAPSSLAFAPAVIYFTQVQTLTITNGTAAAVTITSAAITGVNASDFAIGPGATCGSAVPANATCTYQISFTPTAAGARAAYFVLGNSSPNSSIAIALAGSGTPGPANPVTLTPASATFPTTNAGSSSSINFTLANAAYIGYPILYATNGNHAFTQTNNCPSQIIPAAGSCTITMTFSPTVAGTQTDTLAVQYFDSSTNTPTNLSSTVTALGTAATLQFSSPSLSFPATPIGTAAQAQTVMLYNYGSAPASNLAASFSLAGASSFSQTNNCPANLAVNAFCTFTVTAAPTQLGSITANLIVSSAGSTATLPATVTGTAGNPSNNPLILSDSQFYVPSGGSTVITLTNTGTGPITVAMINTSAGFSQTNTCGNTLAAGATCNAQLTAAAVPSGSGPVTGTLTVSSNAQTLVQTAALYTASHVYDFGSVIVGYPAAQPFAQYANYGAVYTNGPDVGDFPSAGTNGGCGRVGPCIVYTQFVPTAVGRRIATSLNSGQITLMVGTGIPATGQVTSFSISAASIDFGSYYVGSTAPQPVTLTLTNTGNQPVPINAIATQSSFFVGYQFPETNTCGSSLPVGSTCNITVSFFNTNGGSGYATGQLTISTYSLTPIIVIPLTADPIYPQVNVSFSTTDVPLLQTQAGTASTARTITLTNNGNTPITVKTGPYTSGSTVFSYATTCAAVAIGGTCAITVNATPPSAGAFSDVLPVVMSPPGSGASLTQDITVRIIGY